jgi:hypothetical protein
LAQVEQAATQQVTLAVLESIAFYHLLHQLLAATEVVTLTLLAVEQVQAVQAVVAEIVDQQEQVQLTKVMQAAVQYL